MAIEKTRNVEFLLRGYPEYYSLIKIFDIAGHAGQEKMKFDRLGSWTCPHPFKIGH